MHPRRFPMPPRSRGVALPVMLIILAVMLVGSIYLLRNTHSTTLTTGNLAYDATLGKQADQGLHTAFEWLRATSVANKEALKESVADKGYVAHLDTSQSPRDGSGSGFWAGSQTLVVGDTKIEYIIHRMCAADGAFDASTNRCVQTASQTASAGNKLPFGSSPAVDTADYASTPMLHYVITARISGPRGASVINQMIVMIGA